MKFKPFPEPVWTDAEVDAYRAAIPEDETLEQKRVRCWKGPVPTGVDPKDQAYICPHCGARAISYRRNLLEPPGPAIIPSKPSRPSQAPRICCSAKCYEIEWEQHARMTAEWRETWAKERALRDRPMVEADPEGWGG